MKPEHALKIIDEAERIKSLLEGRYLYDQVIDMDNTAHVIVAAYLLGRSDERTGNVRNDMLHVQKPVV